jgi:hypothetical protein
MLFDALSASSETLRKMPEGQGINIYRFPATNIAGQFANINIAAECNRSYLWR